MARRGSMQHRRGGLKSKAGKLMVVCMGGVLLIASGQAGAEKLREGLQHRGLQQQASTTVTPTINGATATCTFPTAVGQQTVAASSGLKLSKESLTAVLQCSGEQGATISTIPPNLGANVCVTNYNGKESDKSCRIEGSTDGAETALKELLGTTRDITWTKKTVNEISKASTPTDWSLELLDSDLPLSEKAFFVGCQQTTGTDKRARQTKSCTVTVNVDARDSAVGANNVVTCAYGKNSNPEPLKVVMTTEKNTLTLHCGSEGSVNPASYETQFCDPQGKDMKNCVRKNYVDILPTFLTSWWTKEHEGSTVKLTIPETDFPESEQQFRLSCVLKDRDATNPESEKVKEDSDGAQAAATASRCNVVVVVKSANFASFASPAAEIAAAAAVTGLFASSL